jgi:hypothetical protein
MSAGQQERISHGFARIKHRSENEFSRGFFADERGLEKKNDSQIRANDDSLRFAKPNMQAIKKKPHSSGI